jgi:PAS domain S-box-containing protein
MQQEQDHGNITADEEYFHRVVDSAPLMIWIAGVDQLCTYLNTAWLSFTGRTLEDELGQGWSERIHPQDVEQCLSDYQAAFVQRREFLLEYRLRRWDGVYRWILDKGIPFYLPDGQFVGYMGSCVDITERKEMEEELRRSEERYRAVVEDQTEFICRFLPDGTITFVNDAYCRYFGRSRKETTGHSLWQFIPEEEHQKARDHLASISLKHPVATIEHQVVSDGVRRWQQWSDRGIFDAAGKIIEFQSVGRDITARKESEEALLQSESKFRAIFESNLLPLVYWQADGRITDANDAYLRLIDYSREELHTGKLRWDLMTVPEDRHLDEQAIKELQNGKRAVTPFEKRYRRKGGQIVSVLIGGTLLPGFTDRGIAFAINLSDQKWLEEELIRERALHTAVVSSLCGHVAVIDHAGCIIAVNESWIRFAAEGAGAKDKVDIGANYLNVCAEALQCRDATAKEAVEGIRSVLHGEKSEFLLQYQCNSSAPLWFEMRVEPLRRPEGGAVISHMDVTNRVRAEIEAEHHRRELAHVARVTLLGEITASIAHEVNQPLTAILSNAQAGQRLLGRDKRSSVDIRDILADIVADGKRAGEVIHRLQSLLKKGESQKQALDLNAMIEHTLRLVHSEMIMRQIVVEKQFDPGLPPVFGDKIQLQQVVLNLMVNAAEAMAESSPAERRVILSTFRGDRRIAIRVRDFGPGLDAKYLEQIFEPFVTTKQNGMGVGLWINRAIIEAHGGELLAANNDDKGATFQVMLPTHEGTSHDGVADRLYR